MGDIREIPHPGADMDESVGSRVNPRGVDLSGVTTENELAVASHTSDDRLDLVGVGILGLVQHQDRIRN